MLKNDVEKYLKKHGIEEKDLNEVATKALEVYRKVRAIYDRNPDNPIMKENVEQSGKDAIKVIEMELKEKGVPQARKKRANTLISKRKKSLKQVKKSEKALDELELCRIKLKEDRKKKLESGEIKPPKKKSRVTKVKESFTRILKLMPSEDEKIIEKSEQLLRKCAIELFKLNGLNRIESVVKELEEVGDKKSGEDKKPAKAA